jgi:phosphatidylglycerophosphate synthase
MVRSTSATLADSRFATARSRLGGAQKSTASVPAYLRFVNRRAGGWLAALAYAVDLTPTQVTVLSAASSFAGIVLLLLAPASVGTGLGVAALLLFGYALDSADGQLARVRGGGSRAGEWLDHVVDMAKLSSLHAAVAVSVLRFFDVSRLALAIPLIFGIANATQFLGMMLRDQLRAGAEQTDEPKATASEHRQERSERGAEQAARTGSSSVLRAWLLLPLDHGALGLVFLLLGWHTGFLIGYGFLALCTVAFSLRSLAKAYRGLVALDRLGSSG